jgi:two-component system cell cycle response regulator DivK
MRGIAVAKRVLVVEDNELNLKLFCDLLKANGFLVDPVRDARLALDHARSNTPDLIVLDIHMRHISGLDLIHSLKSDDALKRIPILAVTAYAAKTEEVRIRRAGADAFVSKPVTLHAFMQSIEDTLGMTAPL